MPGESMDYTARRVFGDLESLLATEPGRVEALDQVLG